MGINNIYGRIVFRNAMGCAYYYKLLNTPKKQDGWITPSNSLEKEALEHTTTDVFCRELIKD